MNREFLDDRVRQQLGGKLGDPLLRRLLAQLYLEPLALPDPGDLALGVVDLRLQHHVDDESGHIPNSTRAAGAERE